MLSLSSLGYNMLLLKKKKNYPFIILQCNQMAKPTTVASCIEASPLIKQWNSTTMFTMQTIVNVADKLGCRNNIALSTCVKRTCQSLKRQNLTIPDKIWCPQSLVHRLNDLWYSSSSRFFNFFFLLINKTLTQRVIYQT